MYKKRKGNNPREKKQEKIYGDPEYDASGDIYAKGKKTDDFDLEGDEEIFPAKINSLESGLDVPGSELDDADEAIGAEDEENNYYSLGGDDHNDLEEDEPE